MKIFQRLYIFIILFLNASGLTFKFRVNLEDFVEVDKTQNYCTYILKV